MIEVVLCLFVFFLSFIIIEYLELKARNTHYDLKTGKVIKRKQ